MRRKDKNIARQEGLTRTLDALYSTSKSLFMIHINTKGQQRGSPFPSNLVEALLARILRGDAHERPEASFLGSSESNYQGEGKNAIRRKTQELG